MKEFLFQEISIGQNVSFEYELNEKKMQQFLEITGDSNPLHNDLDYARSLGHNDKVVYGMLTSAILSTLAGMYLPGKYSLIHEVEIKFLKPVYIKDSPLIVEAEVTEKDDRFNQITLKYQIKNQSFIKVCKGRMKIGVLPKTD